MTHCQYLQCDPKAKTNSIRDQNIIYKFIEWNICNVCKTHLSWAAHNHCRCNNPLIGSGSTMLRHCRQIHYRQNITLLSYFLMLHKVLTSAAVVCYVGWTSDDDINVVSPCAFAVYFTGHADASALSPERQRVSYRLPIQRVSYGLPTLVMLSRQWISCGVVTF